MSLIGYARVSTLDQDLSAQLEALKKAGCSKIYHGKQSGKSGDNLARLEEMLDYVREGDTVILTKLDRMGRSLSQILNTIQALQDKGVHLITLDGQVNTASNNPMQKALTQLLGVFAELEHSIIVDRLQSGRERTGRRGGRKPVLTSQQKQQVIDRHSNGESKSKLAKEYEVSRATIMRVVS